MNWMSLLLNSISRLTLSFPFVWSIFSLKLILKELQFFLKKKKSIEGKKRRIEFLKNK